ncbi:MAG: carboxypeptidase-like regulatory domain-containing protein [Chitinophagaceae bacterium]
MSDKKTIAYSAADIERYQKGLMSSKEMHALEKAALDDPFLADALEGYTDVPVNTTTDLALLNKKLDQRIATEERKIIPLHKSNFGWLRIAALFIIIIGAGLLTYNYVLSPKKREAASLNKSDTLSNKTVNSSQQPVADKSSDTMKQTEETTESPVTATKQEKEPVITKTKKTETVDLSVPQKQFNSAPASEGRAKDVAINDDNEIAKVKADTISNLETAQSKKSGYEIEYKYQNSKDLARDTRDKSALVRKSNSVSEPLEQKSFAKTKINYFRGQVLDANNSPLPFANVMILPDHIGTYTDAKGNFVLISPDSTLDVRVRSVGFENDTAKLFVGASANTIVLNNDTKNIPSTVLAGKKSFAVRKPGDNMTVEEPEPADGWANYDTYLLNNIEISEEIKKKTTPSTEVELSFDVNDLGEPVNVKVEKSACKECDAEAIRLLKEGPKWKNLKTNKRGKLSFTF